MKRKEPETQEDKKEGENTSSSSNSSSSEAKKDTVESAEKKPKSTTGVVPEQVKRELPDIDDYSEAQITRLDWKTKLPPIFSATKIPLPVGEEEEATIKVENKDVIEKLYPNTIKTPVTTLSKGKKFAPGKKLKVGIVFSGGQAAGGHNVVTGLYRYLKSRNKDSQVFGFIGGPIGIIKGKYIEVTEKHVETFHNIGGFHMLEAGRDKIQTPQEFESSLDVCTQLELDGLVICGKFQVSVLTKCKVVMTPTQTLQLWLSTSNPKTQRHALLAHPKQLMVI